MSDNPVMLPNLRLTGLLVMAVFPALSAFSSPELSLNPGGTGYKLNWDSRPGGYYAIERSHALQDWETLESGILAEDISL